MVTTTSYKREWRKQNASRVNAQRRARHAEIKSQVNAARRHRYAQNAEAVLAKMKADRAECPICGRSCRRLYISRHIATRHTGEKCPAVPI